MKVNDLKAELAARNLDTKGVKAVLVERLKEAFEKENSSDAGDSASAAAASKRLDVSTPCPSTPVRRSRRRSITRSPSPIKTEVSQLKSVCEEDENIASVDLSCAQKKRRTLSITKSPPEVNFLDVLEEKLGTDKTLDAVTPNKPEQVDMNKETAEKSDAKLTKQDISEVITNINKTNIALSPPDQEKPITEDYEVTRGKFSPDEQADITKTTETKNIEFEQCLSETQEANNCEKQTTENQHDESSKSDKDNSSSKQSFSKTPRVKPTQTAIEFLTEENEPVIDNSQVLLSWFDSDLNLEIDPKTFDVAKPISDGALSLLWAAARANWGVMMGKIAFEVILTKTNEFHKVTEEPVTSEFRVGWSTADNNLQLGEAKNSFAYSSTGLKGKDGTFTDYGSEYKINDVIGVYLDLDSTPCKIEYTVNNIKQGTAFEFNKVELEGKALYPHVCSKNIAFKVNFGQHRRSLLNDRQKPEKIKEDNKNIEKSDKISATNIECVDTGISNKMEKPAETKPPIEEEKINDKKDDQENTPESEICINPEYVYITQAASNNLVRGPCRPESRDECELIFLIGLPASGKTHWVQNYVSENVHKKTTILSVDTLLDQMRLLGEPRKPANTMKWSRLVEQLSKSLNKLIEIASKRRKNFIIDQTNVFLSEQKRKLRGFGEYSVRRAVIVITDEKEHERRIKQKNNEFGMEVQEQHLNVMKAHLHIPSVELNWFTHITYAELDEEKAIARVKELNDFGQKALPRRFHRNQQQRRGVNNSQRRNQGKNRYSSVQQHRRGGYYPYQQRYNNTQQFSQNLSYRAMGGYGRRDPGPNPVGHYDGNTDWTRGRYDNQYNRRSTGISQVQRYSGNNRGYNSGSGWSQHNSNCWSYGGNQGNATQQWYSWWQSNLKNLLQQQGGVSGDNNNSQQINMEQYWTSQYRHQRNYGNYTQSQGSRSAKKK